MSTDAWQYRQESDGIGILTLDVPGKSANTLRSFCLTWCCECVELHNFVISLMPLL